MTTSLNDDIKPPMKPVCASCDSDDIRADAYVIWNSELELWEIENQFDDYHCGKCDGETCINWVEV